MTQTTLNKRLLSTGINMICANHNVFSGVIGCREHEAIEIQFCMNTFGT